MWDRPKCGCENELNLLPSRETADLSVRSKLFWQAKVVKVLLNLSGCDRTQVEPSLFRRDPFIRLLQQMLKAEGQQLVTRVVFVILLGDVPLFHLVFQLSGTKPTTPDALELKVVNCLCFILSNAVALAVQLL